MLAEGQGLTINGFSVTTRYPDGTWSTQSLPFSAIVSAVRRRRSRATPVAKPKLGRSADRLTRNASRSMSPR